MYYTGHGRDTKMQPELLSRSGILSLGVTERIVAAELSEALPLANCIIVHAVTATNTAFMDVRFWLRGLL